MSWFNYYGLIAVAFILLPNILCAIFDKTAFENKVSNKALLALEQIGRYGCMVFMVFNIPYTWFGFWFPHALIVYLSVNGTLLLCYFLGWVLFRKGKSAVKMLWLSITPTLIFLFSGISVASIPLLFTAVLFGIGHVTISWKNRE